MTQISIQEQKDYLKEQLYVEPLTVKETNRKAIQKFSATKKGKGLEKYLKNLAWKEDLEGSTKVYLVKDKQTDSIVFFFALNAGLLYKELGDREYDLTDQESEIIDLCIEYEELFHWQSQNATAANTLVGQRYIHHEEQQENILLFVREQKDDTYGSVPFMFLGKAKYVSHQGDKPMSIVWKLENKIPAKFLSVTDKLGIG